MRGKIHGLVRIRDFRERCGERRKSKRTGWGCRETTMVLCAIDLMQMGRRRCGRGEPRLRQKSKLEKHEHNPDYIQKTSQKLQLGDGLFTKIQTHHDYERAVYAENELPPHELSSDRFCLFTEYMHRPRSHEGFTPTSRNPNTRGKN